MSLDAFATTATVYLFVQTRNASDVPLNADAAPRFIVYHGGTGAKITSLEGQASQAHTGTVTGATNATPIVITTVGHGLVTGTRVTVASVGGNTAANGTFLMTKVDADTFSLDTSVGNGAYTSGGTWNVSGLYSISIATSTLTSGTSYYVLAVWAISSSGRAEVHSFTYAG